MEEDKKELPELLSIKHICERLDIHPNTLRKWEKKGLVECYRVGARRDRRFLKEDIMRMFRRDYEQDFRIQQAEWRREQALEAQERRRGF